MSKRRSRREDERLGTLARVATRGQQLDTARSRNNYHEDDGKVRESGPASNESTLMRVARNNFSILISSPTSARCTCIIRLHVQLPPSGNRAATLYEQFMRNAPCRRASTKLLYLRRRESFRSVSHRVATRLISSEHCIQAVSEILAPTREVRPKRLRSRNKRHAID